jgi:hypothetical protein
MILQIAIICQGEFNACFQLDVGFLSGSRVLVGGFGCNNRGSFGVDGWRLGGADWVGFDCFAEAAGRVPVI